MQSEVTHLDEAAGQHVLEKEAKELGWSDGGCLSSAIFATAIAEPDGMIIGRENMAVGKRHPVDVPGEINQSFFAASHRLGMDYPGLCPDIAGDGCKNRRQFFSESITETGAEDS